MYQGEKLRFPAAFGFDSIKPLCNPVEGTSLESRSYGGPFALVFDAVARQQDLESATTPVSLRSSATARRLCCLDEGDITKLKSHLQQMPGDARTNTHPSTYLLSSQRNDYLFVINEWGSLAFEVFDAYHHRIDKNMYASARILSVCTV